MKEGCSNKITFEYLKSVGWVKKADIMVRFSHPRMDYKSDGTLILGYHEYPKKVFDIDQLNEILALIPEE